MLESSQGAHGSRECEIETAQRELFEETGLTARLNTSCFAMIEYPISSIARKQVVFFPGQVDGVPNVRIGEIEGFRWVTKEELGAYLFPDTVKALQKILDA